jgi:hypothetical protein
VHEYPDNDIADELAWWGKEDPLFCRLRPGGGEGASRNGPAANYEARAERRAEEKAAAARAADAVGDAVAAARAAAAMGGAADVAQGGVGGATLGTGPAIDVSGVARGATENDVCDDVGQLSDPLEGHLEQPTLLHLTLPYLTLHATKRSRNLFLRRPAPGLRILTAFASAAFGHADRPGILRFHGALVIHAVLNNSNKPVRHYSHLKK